MPFLISGDSSKPTARSRKEAPELLGYVEATQGNWLETTGVILAKDASPEFCYGPGKATRVADSRVSKKQECLYQIGLVKVVRLLVGTSSVLQGHLNGVRNLRRRPI